MIPILNICLKNYIWNFEGSFEFLNVTMEGKVGKQMRFFLLNRVSS